MKTMDLGEPFATPKRMFYTSASLSSDQWDFSVSGIFPMLIFDSIDSESPTHASSYNTIIETLP